MDDVPHYPPGPRGPEDDVPGLRLLMSRHQIEFIAEYVASVEGVSSVQIEERGATYFEVTIFDPENEQIGEPTLVYPLGNTL